MSLGGSCAVHGCAIGGAYRYKLRISTEIPYIQPTIIREPSPCPGYGQYYDRLPQPWVDHTILRLLNDAHSQNSDDLH